MENYIPKEEAKGYIVIDVDTSQVVEATKKTKKLLKLLKKATHWQMNWLQKKFYLILMFNVK